MRKYYLLLAFCAISVLALAQTGTDPVYGFGAVPTVNGQVVFEREINCEGLESGEIMKAVTSWAKGRYVYPIVLSGKVKENPDNGVSITTTEILTFKKTAIITDESKITYSLDITVEKGKCLLKMSDISYRYEEEREGGGMQFTAEEWITDREAFNKSGSKMLKTTGKFRIKTIDLVNSLQESLATALKSLENGKD